MFFNRDDKDKDKDKEKDKSKAGQMAKKYKFKSLLVYSSDEWMANSTKRYRTCFDRAETNYIRVELAFYNKLFDEEDWNCKIVLKAFRHAQSEKKELCNLETDRLISKEDNVVFIRDGWGNTTNGAYWTKGTYSWEAFIDGECIGSQQFFVNDIGFVSRGDNPYFSIDYVRLYTGDSQGWKQQEKKYLKKINGNETKYLWVEMRITNKVTEDWNYELFFNFVDDAGQAKGQVVRNGYISTDKKDFRYTFDAGWGNETPGSWKDDKYSLEIVFMDTLVGAITFDCGAEDVEGDPELITSLDQVMAAGTGNNTKGNEAQKENDNNEKSLDELLKELDALIGLEGVKKSIRENITYLNFMKLRKEKGFEDNSKLRLDSVFTGNPGTGKTTVVRMLGKIYHKMGLLSKGHVHEVDRSHLVAEFIGQTAPKTKKAIEEARGGILFIDEAYSLARKDDDSKDFGKEVIEILLKEMSDGKGDIAIICAGYPKEMRIFLDSNPGLKSRFTQLFQFDDYLPEELFEIATFASTQKQVKLQPEASEFIKEQLVDVYRKRDDSFGNARFVHALIEEAKMNMGLRLMKHPQMDQLSKEDLETVTLDDVKSIFTEAQKKKLALKINEKYLTEAITELNELTGMENIKQEVTELIKLIKFYNETGKDVLNKFSLHSVFTGNPGTGKTTFARILAKIYKALGLLERGHVIETDREGLIAGYVGQTAIKTNQKVAEAMGGVLFVDEAYALSEGASQNDFGKEAIEVILKRMEDNRGKFGVIAAGYTDNMHNFLEMNPGLKSRFDKVFHFEDYSPEQLYIIALNLLKKENLKPDAEAENHLKIYFKNLFDKRDKFFGNARTVRQVIGESIKNQNLRMASLPAEARNNSELETLKLEDVQEFTISEKENKKSLGFRFGGDKS